MAEHLILGSTELLPTDGMYSTVANGVFEVQKEGTIPV
jgi:hypothetical protein